MGKDAAKIIEIKENRKELDEISLVAQHVLENDRNIAISKADAIPTIAYEFFFAAMQYLSKHKSVDKDVMINFLHMFDMGITCRESDDGEKDANFVPFINPGQICKTLVKSDEMTDGDDD